MHTAIGVPRFESGAFCPMQLLNAQHLPLHQAESTQGVWKTYSKGLQRQEAISLHTGTRLKLDRTKKGQTDNYYKYLLFFAETEDSSP